LSAVPHRRLPALVTALVAMVAGVGVAACGSSRSPAASTATASRCAASGASTLRAILRLPGCSGDVQTPDVAVLGGRDYPAGKPVRVPVVLLTKAGDAIRADADAVDIYLAPDALAPALGPFRAHWSSIVVKGASFGPSSIRGVYAANVDVPKAGAYFIVARYRVHGAVRSASTGIQVLARDDAPAVGSRAPASDTPTLGSTHGDLKALTTASPPDRDLLRYSVAGSLAAHVPFMVTFATPAFCQSRVCGPVVGIVQAAARRLRQSRMRFIHVEIYKDQKPPTTNRWVDQWRLQSEPWVFVVGADGRIKARFEGPVSVAELLAAARLAL
jgi:hypothetical protein